LVGIELKIQRGQLDSLLPSVLKQTADYAEFGKTIKPNQK